MRTITLRDFNPDSVTQTTGRIDTVEQAERQMFYRSHLSGSDGAHYELLKEQQHIAEDIADAKKYLRNNFDVLSINIFKEKQ